MWPIIAKELCTRDRREEDETQMKLFGFAVRSGLNSAMMCLVKE